MATKRNARPKPSSKSAKTKGKSEKTRPKASEEFGGEIYAGDDWKRLKRKHPGGFQTTLLDLEKKVWDDGGTSWLAKLDGHEKLAKINSTSGRALAEVFGDDMDAWQGRTVHVMPTQWNTGWGAVIDPIEDDDDDDVSLDEGEDIEDESDDEDVD